MQENRYFAYFLVWVVVRFSGISRRGNNRRGETVSAEEHNMCTMMMMRMRMIMIMIMIKIKIKSQHGCDRVRLSEGKSTPALVQCCFAGYLAPELLPGSTLPVAFQPARAGVSVCAGWISSSARFTRKKEKKSRLCQHKNIHGAFKKIYTYIIVIIYAHERVIIRFWSRCGHMKTPSRVSIRASLIPATLLLCDYVPCLRTKCSDATRLRSGS